MFIRKATMKDLAEIAEIEAICFPAAEACSKETFEQRLTYFADHFWVLVDQGKIISFVNGYCTNQRDLDDNMYADASLHDENGAWQIIFGVNTLPEYRGRGYASTVLKQVISDAKKQGRKGLVLTCKKEKVHLYGSLGFVMEGLSESEHGGATWYQMRLTF